MFWIPNALDIYPKKHIWGVMERTLGVQKLSCRNISDMRDLYMNICYNRSPAIYEGLLASMPKQVVGVLQIKCGLNASLGRWS